MVIKSKGKVPILLFFGVLISLITVFALGGFTYYNQLHPAFPLLDKNGENVINSGGMVSTRNTCGPCHEYDVIINSYHMQQGLNEIFEEGEDRIFPDYYVSPGMFGKFCGPPYLQLTPLGVEDEKDFTLLTTPTWLRNYCGNCHLGSGPSEFDREGRRLDTVDPAQTDPLNPDYHYLENGEIKEWDWRESGVMEASCFLCHTPDPRSGRLARDEALRAGNFGAANTASLIGRNIVSQTEDGSYSYNQEAFDNQGNVMMEYLQLQDPKVENCEQCHGIAAHQIGKIEPFFEGTPLRGIMKFARIFSGTHISETDINLENKEEYDYPWDAHAAAELECIECHHSINNPARAPRDLDWGYIQYQQLGSGEIKDYLRRPNHNFAKGRTCPETIMDELDDTMRRCIDCHSRSIENHAEWLPYTEHHFNRLGCEVCHIPQKHYWAFMSIEWTTLMPNGKFKPGVRGIDVPLAEYMANPDENAIRSWTPAYLTREDADGERRIMPYNMFVINYWFDQDNQRPVYKKILMDAFYKKAADDTFAKVDGKFQYNDRYVEIMDRNSDGKLTPEELTLTKDDTERIEKVEQLLIAAGAGDPVMHVEMVPFGINHNVVRGEHAIRECSSCHSSTNNHLVNEPLKLLDYIPAAPVEIVRACTTKCPYAGEGEDPYAQLTQEIDGKLYYNPLPAVCEYYFVGFTRVDWVEWFGWLTIIFSLALVLVHGGLRIKNRNKKK